MPFPSYIPRSDSFGNWYFGGFQVDSAVEAGYGAGTALTATQAEFNTFLDAALGSTNWTIVSGVYYFKFANPYEPLTGQASSTNNRFWWAASQNQNNVRLNTALTGSPITVQQSFIVPGPADLFSASFCGFAVANQYGIWFARGGKGSSGTLTASVISIYFGWVKDPVFPTNNNERVRNLIAGGGTSVTDGFLATRAANTTSVPTQCVTNSVINCQTSTPGANITDLCVLDPLNNYLNIGSLYNAVFYPGTGLTVGQIYRIPPAQDPDGNTEQNIWLCAERIYGWNGSAGVANAGYKLIRVWSNNIT